MVPPVTGEKQSTDPAVAAAVSSVRTAALSPLREEAEAIKRQLEEGKPARHQARVRALGGLLVSGRFAVPLRTVNELRRSFEAKGEKFALMAQVFGLAAMEQQGWRADPKDGDRLVGPGSHPAGAPPRLGTALPAAADEPSPSGGGGGGSSGGPVSRAEARRQIAVREEHARWSEGLREHEEWRRWQALRARGLGEYFVSRVLASAASRREVHECVRETGDAGEIELWSDEDLRADYSPDELGEDGKGDGDG